jgi:hypothetical protein
MNRQFRVGPVRRLAAAAAGTLLACAVTTGLSTSRAATVKKADDTSLTGPLVALENGAAVFEVKPEKGGGKPQRTPVPLADIVEITIDPAADVPGGDKAGGGKGGDKQETKPSAKISGNVAVINMFDGNTLKGWKGDTDIWSVKDGAITGASEQAFPSGPEHVSYLVYNDDLGDFELRYRFKINGGVSNSSGVMFRAAEGQIEGEAAIAGFQQDLGWPPEKCGRLVDTFSIDGRQVVKAEVGQRATFKEGGERETTALAKSPEDLNAKLKENDWNDAVLAVKGNRAVSIINGEVFAELIDQQKASPRKGKLALQFGRRAAMTVQFKDLKLRKLGPADVPETPGVKWEKAGKSTEVAKADAAHADADAKVAAAEAAAAAAAAAAASKAVETKAVEAKAEAKADAAAERKSSSATGSVKKIFDGTSLKGWEGDEDVWSVQGGVITGKVDENNQNSRVTYLTYTGEEFSDFQLSFTFKVVGGQRNSSGVQFRSKVVENGDLKDVAGYQQDFGHNAGLSGQIVDSGGNAKGQPLKASVGERAIYDAQGNRSAVPLDENAEELSALFKADEWNDATLVVRGNHMVSMINGHVFAEAINEIPESAKKGVIAFQISRRQLMSVEIKNLSMRTLGPKELPKVKGVDWAKVLNDKPGSGAAVAKGDEAKGENDADKKAKNVTAAWQARLAGGDQVSGEMLGWDDKALRLKTQYGELSIPVKQLREVWHGSTDEIEKARAAARSAGTTAATEDTAFARKDDQVIPVNGLVRGTTTDSLNFRFHDEDKQIKLEKLVGVALAVAEDAVADDSLQQSLVFTSGDVVSGRWTALENGSVTLVTPWNDTLKVPVKSFERIRTKNGRLVYLSDLAPAAVEQTPYFDRMLAFRTDKSLTGSPIKLADGDHAKGLSVHSRTVLRYDIGRKYERFRAKLGFQQPEGKGGRVAVRVLGDNDKVLHEIADARGDQPPADLDLNVAGVSRLTLEVDFGAEQDVGDRFVWADARLLRAGNPGK